jgi:hypothetical protein
VGAGRVKPDLSPGDLLRRLDQRVLPPLGEALHRLGRGADRIGRSARRLRPLTWAAVVAVCAVLFAAGWVASRPDAVTSDPTLGDVVYVGVAQGASIPEYVTASGRELTALAASAATTGSGVPGSTGAETYALVSFAGYLSPDRLAVVDGVAVVQVYARVRLPERQTEIVRIPAVRVPEDVVAGMAGIAAEKESEAARYQRLARDLDGSGEREREQRATYTSGAEVAAAEASAYRGLCSCVYAAVVRATAADLDRLADRAEVRAVDPAPEVERIDRAVFTPPLPEQSGIAGPPADRDMGR